MRGRKNWESEEDKGPKNQEGSSRARTHTRTHLHTTPDNNSATPLAQEWRAPKWGEKVKEPEVK